MNEAIQLLLSAGGAGVLAALINAVMNRRKLSAEATQIITMAAAGTVENVVKDNTTLRAEVAELRRRVDEFSEASRLHEEMQRAWKHDEERYRWHLERWQRYAHAMRALLESNKVAVTEEEPALYPDLRQ